MKNLLIFIAIFLTTFIAEAATVNPDIFVAESAKFGSPTAETTWANSLVSESLTFTTKTENVTYEHEYGTFYSFDLAGTPDYFIVKNATRVALFQNVDSFSLGVFDTSLLSDSFNLPDTSSWTISHATELAGTTGTPRTTQVPEPAILAMLGLAGLGLRRKITTTK